MRPTRHHLKQGWVYLLACLFCTSGYARANVAGAPPMLRDVRLVYQDQRWDVVLRGSDLMTYEAVKKDDPLRLVVDLPNAVSNTVSYRKILDNEIIDSIDVLVLVHSPQPKTRVVIGLNQDIAYEISRSREEIRVSFAAPTLLSQTDSAPDKKAAESVADAKPAEARQAQTAASAHLPEEKSGDSAMADEASGSVARVRPIADRKTRIAAIPRLSEEESGYSARDVGGSNLPPASKLLQIRVVEVEEKLIVSLVANGSLHNYHVFHLTSPPRLVVDIMGIQSTEVKSILDFGGPLVEKIRIALRANKVRVVFDLIPRKGLPYRVVSGNDRLQVSFMPGSGFPPLELTVRPPTNSKEADESVQRFVEKWRLAWEKGDLLSYLACYHPQFRDRDMDLEGWGQYKELLFQSYPERVILLTDTTAEWKGSAAIVVARQKYQAGTRQDFGLKTLHLRWHRGHWNIFRESWQPLPDPG